MEQSRSIFRRFPADKLRSGLVLLVLYVCILAISLTFFSSSIGRPYMGIRLIMDSGDWKVAIVDTNGLASRAGLKGDEKPLEINGQPAQVFLGEYGETGTVFGRLIREITVIDSAGQLKSVTLAGSSRLPLQSVISQLSWLLVCLVFWLTGFYAFFKKPGAITARLLCLCGLSFGLAISGNVAVERGILSTIYLEVAATTLGPWLLLHFFLILPEERAGLRSSHYIYLIYLPVVVTLVLFPLVGYADGQPLPWFRSIRMFEIGLGFLAAAGAAVFNYFGADSPKTRQQMKIVLVSCLVALVPSLVLNIIPEAIWERTILSPAISILSIMFIPLGMGFAVVTSKLMDIDVVVRRGIIYSLVTIVMAAIVSAGIFLTLAFQRSFDIPERIVIAIVLGGIASFLFGPTKRGVEYLVDRLFYKDRYDYRQIIQGLSISMNILKDFTDVPRVIVATTVQTLNLAGACLFTKTQPGIFEVSAAQGSFSDEGKQLQLLNLISRRSSTIEFPNSAASVNTEVAFLIPLVTMEIEVGLLCISPKASRQEFSADDLFLLQGLASVAAPVLRGAILVRDVSMRDSFVSIASHELRTPLTSIMGYAELLIQRDPPEATRKQWLKTIYANSEKIATMVDELLNITRIHSGKLKLKLEKAGLPGIIDEQMTIIREATCKHEFIVNLVPDIPEVLIDRTKFGQIIGNLLSNAVKYSPKGGRIVISARNDLQDHHVVVSIADEGIGIGPADKDELFTTFHRIQRPETQGIRGSGLGLYIAKEWTEAMGGRIWLESELNRGSTFFVSVPMGEPNQ